MTYEEMTDMIDLEELEVQAEDVSEISAAAKNTLPHAAKPCRYECIN